MLHANAIQPNRHRQSEIVLLRIGHSVCSPGLPPEVLKQFITVRREGSRTKSGAFTTVPRGYRMFTDYGAADGVELPAGLAGAVIAACREAGFRVRLQRSPLDSMELPQRQTDRRTPKLWTGAALQPHAIREPIHPAVLEMVRRHDRGLVRHGLDEESATALVAEIAVAWPRMSVSVVTQRIDSVGMICDQLRSLGIDAVPSSSRHRLCVGDATRVVVSTRHGLVGEGVHEHWRQIGIFTNALDWLGEGCESILKSLSRARIYGLLPIGVEPSPHEADLMRMRFGFAEAMVPTPGFDERTVTVDWRKMQSGTSKNYDNSLKLMHSEIWHNEIRNRLVASMAKEVDRDARAVGGRTLLLVVNGEHAIAIAKRLRWPVVGGFVTNDFGLSDTEIDLLREHRSPFQQPPSPAIVTFEGLARYDLSEISTIIRADGGSGLPPIERHRLTCRPGTAPLAIVDIDGDRAHVLRRAARRRHRLLKVGSALLTCWKGQSAQVAVETAHVENHAPQGDTTWVRSSNPPVRIRFLRTRSFSSSTASSRSN